MISKMYFYSSGCSFGHCIDSNMRTDKCIATENTQLLRVRGSNEMFMFLRGNIFRYVHNVHVLLRTCFSRCSDMCCFDITVE